MRIFVAHDFMRLPIRGYRDAFEKVAARTKVQFIFGDSLHAADHLLEQIERMIVEADACLFDVSTPNRNVFLELGFARGRGKPHYLLFKRRSKLLQSLGFIEGVDAVPSDIQGQRLKLYKNWHSLFGQLITVVEELVKGVDLSGQQGLLEARIGDMLARHPDGLLIGQIANEIKLDQTLVFAILKILREQHRVEQNGYGNATRYRPAVQPMKAVI